MKQGGRIRVGVLFGGRSGEHEISLRSALTVISALDPARYEIVPIGIGRDGRWSLENDALKMLGEAAPRLAELERGATPVSLMPYPDSRALVETSGPARRTGAKLPGPLDVIFPVLHGTYGEDGTIQGLLELADVPYVGAGVLGSAIGMDKDVQKRLLRDAKIPVVRHAAISKRDARGATEIAGRIGYPLYIKPNALGSSIGVSRVSAPGQLARALKEAFRYDRKVLLEAACEGREIECAVLGNDAPAASIPGEIVIRGAHEFYSYESKYIDPEGARIDIPAKISPGVSRRIRTLAIAAFRALNIRGMARVDFFVSRDLRQIFVNELNTIPGFTSISMYPKLWEASGLPLPKLIDRLIKLALEDHRARGRLAYTYQPRLR